MFSRVSTAMLFRNTMSDMNRVMSNVNRLSQQISSQEKITSYLDFGAGGKVEKVIDLETKFTINNKFLDQNKIIKGRLEQYDISISRVLTLAMQFRDNMVLRRSPAGKDMQITQIVKSYLSGVRETLNTSYEGRYLFAGSRTTTLPVDMIEEKSNLENDNPTDNYYNGDNFVMSVKISETLEIDYGITANDKVFQDLIGSMHLALQADKDDDFEKFGKALDNVTETIQGLVQTRTNVGNNLKMIKDIGETMDKVNESLNSFLKDELVTNEIHASTELIYQRTILEATFKTFAITSSLSLLDYLR